MRNLLFLLLVSLLACGGESIDSFKIRVLVPCDPYDVWQQAASLELQMLDGSGSLIDNRRVNPRSIGRIRFEQKLFEGKEKVTIYAIARNQQDQSILTGKVGPIDLKENSSSPAIIILTPLNKVTQPGLDTKGTCINLGPFPQGSAVTRLKDGRLLMTGGLEGGVPSSAAYLIDPNYWRYDNDLFNDNQTGFSGGRGMFNKRAFHTSTLLDDGRVLIYGGTGVGSSLRTAEIFDPVKSSFTRVPVTSKYWRSHHAAYLENGLIYFIGGQENKNDRLSYPAEIEVFDVKRLAFFSDASFALSTGRSYFGHFRTGNTVFVLAGKAGFNKVPSIEKIDLTSKSNTILTASFNSGGAAAATFNQGSDKALVFLEKCEAMFFSVKNELLLGQLNPSCDNFTPLNAFSFADGLAVGMGPEGIFSVREQNQQINFLDFISKTAAPAFDLGDNLIFIGSGNASAYFRGKQ